MRFTALLDRATQLFTFAKSGWDTKTADPDPGGIFWVQQGSVVGLTNHDRATGPTGGGAELGFHLHLLTGLSSYDGEGTLVASPASLGGANMMNWVNAYFDSSQNGTGLYRNAGPIDGRN